MVTVPSLRNLHYLVALADRLSFTQAAQACFVTQSTLSSAIKELEAQLQVRLVERDRHKVRMTPIGLATAKRARGLLAGAQDLAEAARAASDPLGGVFSLGAIPTIAPFVLPALLPLAREALPKLRLALREDLTANLLEAVRDGRLDAALIALPYPADDLLVVPLFTDELWLVARPGDPHLARMPLDARALDRDRLLLLAEGHCLREQTLAACEAPASAPRDAPAGMEATSLLTLIQMVDQGFGVALVPEMSVKASVVKGTDLVARPLASPAPTRTIALVARTATSRRSALDRLGELIVSAQRAQKSASLNVGAARRRAQAGR